MDKYIWVKLRDKSGSYTAISEGKKIFFGGAENKAKKLALSPLVNRAISHRILVKVDAPKQEKPVNKPVEIDKLAIEKAIKDDNYSEMVTLAKSLNLYEGKVTKSEVSDLLKKLL